MGVETGGCPHTAIRDDTTMNAVAVEKLQQRHPDTKLVLIESGETSIRYFSRVSGCIHLCD